MKIIFPLFWLLAIGPSSFGQVLSDSIRIGPHFRSFHFIQPSANVSGASLVFVLHGSGGNGRALMERTLNFIEEMKTENAVLVYPDGYKNYWNECRKEASSLANKENIDEKGFFSAMIAYFKVRYGIHDRKVFAVGTSGGGHMCYKLAMTLPGHFRAITAIIANLPDAGNMDCLEAGKAIPVMIVNGTHDPTNPYAGGMMQSANFRMGMVRSTEASFRYWAGLAGYRGDPLKTTLPDADPEDEKTIERYTFKEKGKPEVVLLKVIGGRHDYPGDIDVHWEAWQFFKRQIEED